MRLDHCCYKLTDFPEVIIAKIIPKEPLILNPKVCDQNLPKIQVGKDLIHDGREEDTPALSGSVRNTACNVYTLLYHLQKILHSLSFLVLIIYRDRWVSIISIILIFTFRWKKRSLEQGHLTFPPLQSKGRANPGLRFRTVVSISLNLQWVTHRVTWKHIICFGWIWKIRVKLGCKLEMKMGSEELFSIIFDCWCRRIIKFIWCNLRELRLEQRDRFNSTKRKLLS